MEGVWITIAVAILGSSVLSTIISKIADTLFYKRKRKDDKEDSTETISDKLDSFLEDFNGTNESINLSLKSINKDLNKIHTSLDAHTESIDSLNKVSKEYCDRFLDFEQDQKGVNSLQNAALRQILGQSLKDRAYKFLEDEEVSYVDYEVWMHDFEVYTNLGGNSVIAELKKELCTLPKVYK